MKSAMERIVVASVAAGLFGVFLDVCEVLGSHLVPDGEIVIAQPTNESCGGCTNSGLQCFGYNACLDGCVMEQVFDCCLALKPQAPSTCCPGCADKPCSPNEPCRGSKRFGITSNTCEPVPGASGDCEYYTRRNACLDEECDYYAYSAGFLCNFPPPTTWDLDESEVSCIRTCLQDVDAVAWIKGSQNQTDEGCMKEGVITDYHNACFEVCGVSEARFPDDWWFFTPEDGN